MEQVLTKLRKEYESYGFLNVGTTNSIICTIMVFEIGVANSARNSILKPASARDTYYSFGKMYLKNHE